LATIVNLDAIHVHAAVPAEQTDVVKEGQPANLTFDALEGQQFEGTVRQITMASASGAGTRQVAIIQFENTQGLVKPDTGDARVVVRVGEARDAISVPADAVDRDKEARPIVKVLRGGQWVPVVVEPGLSNGRFTVVNGDVKEGETVQVTPNLL
jgi:multidrug efflux pump subunit AcrA (membrane-fusion protein)